jgi:transposase
MDLSPSYTSAVKKYLPHVDIVFDRFHVTKLLNEALDELRRKERQKYDAAGQSIAKGDRFLFLRNFEDLDAKQRSKLDALFKINIPLAKAHAMKEQFRMFWEKTSKEEAAGFLCYWIYEAVQSGIRPLVRVAKTILRHYKGLLSYYDHKISNGKAEGVNNKIKVLKRSGYGYRDMDYFKLLLYNLHEKSTALVG